MTLQKAGALDRQITIIREIETVAESGSVSKQWGQLAILRAQLIKGDVVEEEREYGNAEAGNIDLRIRFRRGLITADRIIFGLGLYEIETIEEVGRQRMLDLRARMVSRDIPPYLSEMPIIDDAAQDRFNVLSSAQW